MKTLKAHLDTAALLLLGSLLRATPCRHQRASTDERASCGAARAPASPAPFTRSA